MSIQVIKNVTVLTMNKDKRIIENGVVVIEDDLILKVGEANLVNDYSHEQIIDGDNGILMPGMINTHTHASMVVFRSLADDVPDRLNRFILPLEQKLVEKELVSIGAYYSIAEMLLGGVTTFADMYFFEDEVALAAKDMGIRAVLGETVQETLAPDTTDPYGGLKYGEWFINKWIDDSLITPAIAPHAPYSNDSNHLQKAQELADKYNVPLMMHVAEMGFETEKCRLDYDTTPIQYLDSIGLITERLIAAHVIHATEEDLDLLHKHNVGIAHNVGANSKGAKGVAPVASMFKKGMNVGLGTDGPMSGNTLDIIAQMGLVGKVHKLVNNDRSIFPASEIMEMATIGGAKVLKLDHITGSIEVGKKADLVIIETISVNMQPIYDYYSAIVYSANASNVELVMVNGKLLVKDKKLVNKDIKELQKQIKVYRKKIKDILEKENSEFY